jgi:hypothetical protein
VVRKLRIVMHRSGFLSILVLIARRNTAMRTVLLALSASQGITLNTTKSMLRASVGASGTRVGFLKTEFVWTVFNDNPRKAKQECRGFRIYPPWLSRRASCNAKLMLMKPVTKGSHGHIIVFPIPLRSSNCPGLFLPQQLLQ